MTIGSSRENYLKAILVLRRRGGMVRNVDVARYLGVTNASVSTMIVALSGEGYVERTKEPPFLLSLTEAGLRIAERTYERHCFFRKLLVDAGVSNDVAEREACALEHSISDESFSLLRRAVERRRKREDNA